MGGSSREGKTTLAPATGVSAPARSCASPYPGCLQCNRRSRVTDDTTPTCRCAATGPEQRCTTSVESEITSVGQVASSYVAEFAQDRRWRWTPGRSPPFAHQQYHIWFHSANVRRCIYLCRPVVAEAWRRRTPAQSRPLTSIVQASAIAANSKGQREKEDAVSEAAGILLRNSTPSPCAGGGPV